MWIGEVWVYYDKISSTRNRSGEKNEEKQNFNKHYMPCGAAAVIITKQVTELLLQYDLLTQEGLYNIKAIFNCHSGYLNYGQAEHVFVLCKTL